MVTTSSNPPASTQQSSFPPSGEHRPTSLVQAFENHEIAVFYGSHSGTSQELAQRLARELRWRLDTNILLASLGHFSSFELQNIPKNKLTIFLLSSYGDGGPTDSSQLFWDTIFGLKDKDALANLKYSVFGRGSSLYTTFNHAGIKVDEQLEKLGATRFAPYGQSDKMSVLQEDEYFAWKEGVLQQARDILGKKEQSYRYIPSVQMEEVDEKPHKPNDEKFLDALSILSPDQLTPEFVSVSVTSNLDSSKRNIIHSTFDLENTNLKYRTGDYVVVWPENQQEEVKVFLKAFGLYDKKDTTVKIDKRWLATYEQLARHFISINGQVSREFLKTVAEFAPNEEIKRKTLAAVNDAVVFANFKEANVNIGRMMLTLSNGEPWPIPSTFILDVVPPLVPRYYSGTSSHHAEPSKASILATVERERNFQGVATNFLQQLATSNQKGAKIPISIQPSTFRLPDDPKIPLVLIGIGTGVGPYRGFIKERDYLNEQGTQVGEVLVFSGTRDPMSFVYLNDIEKSPNTRLFAGYSRVNGKYVQDVMLEHKQEVWNAVNNNSHFYICGSVSKLRRHARIALIKIIGEYKKLDFDSATKEFKQLKKDGRLNFDLW